MPFYDYVCDLGHVVTLRFSMDLSPETVHCIGSCSAGSARRRPFYPVAFTQGGKLGDLPLSTLHDTAREMEYQVNRSDDPVVTEPGNRIAHAAKVRAEGQMLAGATKWNPAKVWNHREVE